MSSDTITFKVVIPARYASSRLPSKPLLDIAGKPRVVHFIEQAIQSGADDIIVVTDHPDILAPAAGVDTKADLEHVRSLFK